MPRLSKIGAAALAAFGWTTGSSGVSADFLVVAGGGGGNSGGGGAGGYRTSAGTSGGGASAEAKLSLNPTQSYTVTVGAGGSANANGSNSVFSSITSTGGGKGGTNTTAAGNGGSGGGAYTAYKGTGTAGQGYNGGGGNANGFGGGGGAGAVGGDNVTTSGGAGGAGVSSSITGTAVTRAGGGGGGALGSGGAGGSGGGGTGETNAGGSTGGTANTGGGGGGNYNSAGLGSAGGSGIVIISYAGAQQFGGGVVTSVGGNTIHTFTTSGTLSPITPLSASYLVVAGGGGGGRVGGGGGAGGYLTSTATIDPNSTYLVTVGAGGAGASSGADPGYGSNGSNSAFYATTSTGGGGGGGQYTTAYGGQNGGSGGGSYRGTSNGSYPAGTGNSGEGNNGGAQFAGSTAYSAGGGGAGAVGGASTASAAGAGGNGTASSISGSSVTYAGGGGGGTQSGSGASGGTGGGGAGGGGSGTSNTGGGGGGGPASGAVSGNGGSGVVIISYPGSTQQMAGGTVTITGGNVIHTFTSTGYLAPIKYATNSLRFRSSASAYLNRTFKTPTSQQKGTFSFWLKRGALGARNNLFSNDNGTQYGFLEFDANNQLNFADPYSAGACSLVTTQVFRDPAAWYHIVIAFDTTQATSTDRAKFYVNGVQITSFGTATYPSQNANLYMLQAGSAVQIAAFTRNGTPTLDGYLTEYNFIDGQALTPNSFGTFNSYGVWQPITYGGSYGTNGFYLPFTNKTSTTTLGYDFSPNGNNWTTNNISLTTGATYDSMTDVPTLTSATVANYCVLNPLDKNASLIVSDGNLGFQASTTAPQAVRATFAIPSSTKVYAECLFTTWTTGASNYAEFGIATSTASLSSDIGSTSGTGFTIEANQTTDTRLRLNGTSVAITGAVTSGDVFQIAVDYDNLKVWLGKNNTWYDSAGGTTGNPATGANATGTLSSGVTYFPAALKYGTANSQAANFGQRPFSFSPPSGYVALNTYNL